MIPRFPFRRTGAACLVLAFAAAAVQGSVPVEVGLDRVAGGERMPFEGRRLGLVVHAASVTLDGRHAVDVLRQRGFDVVRLFSPEHGIRGEAAAGQRVAGGRDPQSGLEIISLYGERRQPSREDLADLDALIFDLQDAGVRFYTYVSTLLLCLEAAAEADVDFIVLDRPNPLGGERVEGPIAASPNVVPRSFVNMAPGPLVHGLTLGEMAHFVNQRRASPARLTVIPMRGWQRSMHWEETGRPWTPPSPNLRTAEAALVYPGVALLEATSVSEGRGTDAPFLLFGAPWLHNTALEFDVPGVTFQSVEFQPRASSAAPAPKYTDLPCHGWRIRVPEPANATPYLLGLTLLTQLRKQAGFEWLDGGQALTRLVGTPKVLAAIEAGDSPVEIIDGDREDVTAWRAARLPALLY